MVKTNCQYNLPFHPDRKITVEFDGGRISSDSGLLPLYLVDRSHHLSRDFAQCLRDERDQRYVLHSIEEMSRQRLFQIASGYEDCNDADSLRQDAALKTFCDRLPESGEDLASQPTLSRLENQVDQRDLWRLGNWLIRQYVKQLKKSGRKKITLDLDSTDDPTHGQQEFTFWHGYYRCRMYHPLLVFDAETGDLICPLLRAGNLGAARSVVAVLKRLLREIQRRIPWAIEIEIRGDSGFATPDLYEFCEEKKWKYVIGFPRNSRLEREIEEFVQECTEAYQKEGKKQRKFMEFAYRAKSWDRSRRMVAKVEVQELGLNRRFVVTNHCDQTAEELYDHYIQRGQMENYIKVFKKDLAMDRLSCHRFLANQFRLFLHALAYQLFLRLRDYLEGTPWKNLEIETLRRRMIKIGARIKQTTRRIWIHCSSAYPEQETFLMVLRRICPDTS
jgi:hypothetical protein